MNKITPAKKNILAHGITPQLILTIIIGHLRLIMLVSFFFNRKGSNSSFFNAEKSTPWCLAAWGIIGAVISCVTFISVPGACLLRSGKSTAGDFQILNGLSI